MRALLRLLRPALPCQHKHVDVTEYHDGQVKRIEVGQPIEFDSMGAVIHPDPVYATYREVETEHTCDTCGRTMMFARSWEQIPDDPSLPVESADTL